MSAAAVYNGTKEENTRKHDAVDLKRAKPGFARSRGHSDLGSFLLAGYELPTGTVVETIGSGKTRADLAAFEAALPTNPAEDYTGRIEEAFDAGGVTISFADSSAITLTLTVLGGSGFRHSEQSEYPSNQGAGSMAAAASAGARAGGNVINSGGHVVVIEYLAFTRNAGTQLDCAGTMTVRYCLFDGQDASANTGIGAVTASAILTVHHCIFFAFSNRCISAGSTHTVTLENCTGFWADDTVFTATGTVTFTVTSCIAMQPAWSGGTVCLNNVDTSTNVLTSDATGTSGKINKDPAEIIANPNRGELNLHMTTNRLWADDLIVGSGWARPDLVGSAPPNPPWDISSGINITIESDAALIGSHGVQINITDTANKWRGINWPVATPAEYWVAVIFRLRSGFAMANGDDFRLADLVFIDGSNLIEIRISKTSDQHQVLVSAASGGTWTKQDINIGTAYAVKSRVNSIVSGNADWYLTALGSAWGAAKNANAGDFSGLNGATPQVVAPILLAVGAGTSGKVDMDHLWVTSSDPGAPQDASWWGDSVLTLYFGANGTGTTDFQGELLVAGKNDIGALQIPGQGGGGGQFPFGGVLKTRRFQHMIVR